MDPTPSPRPVADLRLVVGGLAAWLAVLATFAVPAKVGLAAGIVAAAGAVVATAGRRAWTPTVAVLLGCAGAAVLATAVRLAAAESSPLADLAAERASVSVRLVVAEDPRPLRSGSGPPRVAVAADVEQVTSAGRGWSASGRVLVFAPADGWRGLLPGQQLRAEGRLALPLRRDLTVAVLSARAAPLEVQPPPVTQSAAGRIRLGLRDAAQVLPDGPRGLLPGLALGDTSALDPTLAEDFRTAGLSHLTAVSGTNCTIVTGAVLLLLRAATLGPRLSAVAAGVALVGFVILVRPSPSVLRAAVMGGIGLLALASGRPRSALPALGAAVLGLVLIAPPLAADPGFALSVLATLGLIVLAPPWAERAPRAARPARRRRGGHGAGRGRAGDRAGHRRAQRRRQPGHGAGQPARRPGGGAGHRARCAGRGRLPGVRRRRRVAGAAGRVAGRLAGRRRHPGGAGARGDAVLAGRRDRWPGARRRAGRRCRGRPLTGAPPAGAWPAPSVRRRCSFRSGWWRPAGRRPAGSSSPVPSARATRWWCAPVRVRPSWWTPVRSRSRSTAACAGWACGRCRCWSSAICTPITSAASPAC